MDLTIVIPTKNGGELFDRVLERVFSQKTEYSYEVICVDSGSNDNTIDIIKKYPCKLYEIEPAEFGHGKTRNYGASKGTGEFIIFITQDALPADENWLNNFIDAMKEDSDIAGGFGKHIPYPDCNILDKRDLKAHFEGFGLENTVYQLEDIERYRNDEGYRHMLAFYSDNNSCMRRKIWEMYPYEDVDFAEDQIWARKMIEMGYKKLYCSDAVVYHSHNYPIETYYQRYFDEFKSLYRLHGYQMFQSKQDMKAEIEAENIRDIAYIINPDNQIENQDYWIEYAKKRNTYRCKAGYLSARYFTWPDEVKNLVDKHLSQQYKQIAVNEKKHDAGSINFWKWLFLNESFFEKQTDVMQRQKIDEMNHNLDILQKRIREKQIENSKNDVCGFYDFIMPQEKIPFDKDAYEKCKDKRKIVNWVIPEMGVGSGGHINIFRFVKYMQEMGFQNEIYILRQESLHTDEDARKFLEDYYEMDNKNIGIHVDINEMGFAHATIATSWITAYCVRDFDNTIRKFYFVQDFEPLFYPVGSDYAFAENTYKFGFYGLTAGDWLRDKLNQDYGMKTKSFHFSYDHDLYKPSVKRDNVKRVFFYARPVTARRDFELGLLALNQLAKLVPDVEVVFAGWDVSNYKIEFKHANFGSVKLTELSDLYAQCDLCLVLSSTNLSLLPLEVMASNSVAVCTKGANSSWLVNEENSVMVDFEPNQIAETLAFYLTHDDELMKIREKGLEFALSTSWDKEAVKVKMAIEEGIEENEKDINTRW